MRLRAPWFRRASSVGATRMFLSLAVTSAAIGSIGVAGASEGGAALRIVRVGHGNVPAMRSGIVRSVDACQVAKHLPQAQPQLPSDAQLAQLAVVEQEELFDGQKWAEFDTQRQIGADAASGCRVAMFVMRHAVVEKTCDSRISGSTDLLGAMMDVTAPSAGAPSIDETALPSRPCTEKPRVVDLQGLPREDAGGPACVWNSAVMAKAMAKIAAFASQPAAPAADVGGFDICLYADRPTVYYQGYGRRVVLMSHTVRRAGGRDVGADFGEAAAMGNLRLASFTSSGSIADARFSRAAVDQFIHLPTKSALGTTP